MTMNCVYGDQGYGDPRCGCFAVLARSGTDRRASHADLSARPGGGRLRASGLGQATGRETGRRGVARSCGTFGTNSALRQGCRQAAGQSQRCQAGTSWTSSTTAAADRLPGGSQAFGLSQVPWSGSSLPVAADPGHRRHSRRHHAGGDRAHDPSLLVPSVPQHRRAGRARRLARFDHRPAGCRPLGLAPLPAGHHSGPDHRRVQLPSPVQAFFRWLGADVAPAAGDPLGLVPGDPGPSPQHRRAPRRRDWVAGQWQDILVVVLYVEGPHLLHDRPTARQSSLEEVLQEGVCRGVGDRLLGRLQRGRLRRSRNACRTCCGT